MLWDYSGPVPVPDTLTLLSRRPWYSMEYNDVVSALALQPWGMTDITSFLAGHQVGLKQYELTNHLGNVQATVSDYPYLRRVGEGDTIKLRNPALASAYDYYPFGMLMPDRYVSDTTGKCITISQPQWISSWTNNIYSAASWVWPGYTPMTGGGTTPASSASVSGGTVNLALSNGTTAPAMLDFHFSVAPVTPQQIVLDVASTMPQIGISVMQQVNGQWVNLAATTAQAGLNTLTFTPAAAQVKLRFYRMDAAYTSKTMSIKTVNLQKRLLSQQTVLVDVCDEVNDKYRFGFNGQEKVNEWAGVGNFMDYTERGQDTRVARFLSVDALTKDFPWYSPYQFAGNTPIQAIDMDGAEEYHYTRIKDNKGNSTLQLIGQNNVVDKVLVGYRSGHSFGNDAAIPVYKNVVNERKVFVVNEIWREPVDKNGGMNMDQPQEWVDFEIRTFYKSYSDAVAQRNGSVSQFDNFMMRYTQYQAAVKVDNAAMPAGGVGNLRRVSTFEHLVQNPKRLFNATADEAQEILGSGWMKKPYGKTGSGWQFVNKKSGAKVYYNSNGRHGGRYWGIKRGGGPKEQVNVKVVNSEYRIESTDGATHIRIDRK